MSLYLTARVSSLCICLRRSTCVWVLVHVCGMLVYVCNMLVVILVAVAYQGHEITVDKTRIVHVLHTRIAYDQMIHDYCLWLDGSYTNLLHETQCRQRLISD